MFFQWDRKSQLLSYGFELIAIAPKILKFVQIAAPSISIVIVIVFVIAVVCIYRRTKKNDDVVATTNGQLYILQDTKDYDEELAYTTESALVPRAQKMVKLDESDKV
jgi:hypothetical protein